MNLNEKEEELKKRIKEIEEELKRTNLRETLEWCIDHYNKNKHIQNIDIMFVAHNLQATEKEMNRNYKEKEELQLKLQTLQKAKEEFIKMLDELKGKLCAKLDTTNDYGIVIDKISEMQKELGGEE